MAKEYQIGDTVYIPMQHQLYTLSTDTWADTDPDANYPKITITDPEGTTKVDAQIMTKQATGKFDYSYELPSDAEKGLWTGYIDVENSTLPDREYFSFEVH